MTAPRRIRLSRAAGWRKPEGAVIVARPTKWGNPYRAGAPGCVLAVEPGEPLSMRYGIEQTLGVALTPADAAHVFRRWLWDEVTIYPRFQTMVEADVLARRMAARRQAILDGLPALRGRDLACWCPLDAACHADVLIELANR